MFPPSLLSTLLLALSVAATPIAPVITVRNSPVSLPISRRRNGDLRNLYQHDLKRANALIGRGSGQANRFAEDASTPAENTAFSYIASVGVGAPATQCECSPDAN